MQKYTKLILTGALLCWGATCVTHAGIFDRVVSGEIAKTTKEKTQPRLYKHVVPEFPESLNEQGISGDVQVQFMIKADGTTSEIKVLESTNELFSEAVVVAIKQWIFIPSTRHGLPVDSTVKMSIPFKAKKPTEEEAAEATG